MDGLRRSKSFHSEVTTRDSEGHEETDPSARVNVARYVRELEQGIKDTVNNMKPRKSSMEESSASSFNNSSSKDLRHSQSFKYPPGRDSSSLNYSRSFKHDSNIKRRSDDKDRYRPYSQPKRTASWYEPSSKYRQTAISKSDNKSQRKKSDLDVDEPSKMNINCESQQLLKIYSSQESPTWCGVDALANRRWKAKDQQRDHGLNVTVIE